MLFLKPIEIISPSLLQNAKVDLKGDESEVKWITKGKCCRVFSMLPRECEIKKCKTYPHALVYSITYNGQDIDQMYVVQWLNRRRKCDMDTRWNTFQAVYLKSVIFICGSKDGSGRQY